MTSGDYRDEYARQVSDFYREAGLGAELWLQPTSPAMATADLFSVGSVVDGLMVASGGRVNVIGISRYVANEANPVLLNGISADIFNALDEAQVCAERYAQQHAPIRIILDGKNLSSTDLNPLPNLRTFSYNRVGLCVASNRAGAVNACIGLLLGRIAAIPVNQNIGRVRTGSVFTDVAYLTNGSVVQSSSQGAAIGLNDKGFIFLRQFVNKAGYFWNDDHMVTADTDDYYSLANGRVIDKASRIAYATFIEELLDTVLVDERGKVLKTTMKQYQSRIERAIGLTMGANQEISNVAAFIDPNQDILATSKLVVDLRITPTGTNRVILVKLGLFNPNAA